jgi:hypothetical protein
VVSVVVGVVVGVVTGVVEPVYGVEVAVVVSQYSSVVTMCEANIEHTWLADSAFNLQCLDGVYGPSSLTPERNAIGYTHGSASSGAKA